MNGMIAAGGRATAEAGQEMLERGGNAVDAAVAAAFASFIAEISVVHWGGAGIAQVSDPATGRQVVYDFFSNMPGLGRDGLPDKLDFRPVTVDFGATTQDFMMGRGSVAVPGNIAGLCQMATDFGRLPLHVLLQPALALARDGLILPAYQASTIKLLEPLMTASAESRAIFAPAGRVLGPDERLFVPHLADTLAQLAREGAAFARTGGLAAAIVADQAANGGLLTSQDLTDYTVYRHAPLQISYREYEALLPPPCSVGGVLTAFSLRLLDHFDVAEAGIGTARALQLLYEVLAATTRAREVWEAAIREVPPQLFMHRFLADSFVRPFVEEVRQALATRTPSAISAEPRSPNHTSHISVIDGEGMAVTLTTTGGESAGYVVPQTGIILNNMLGEADLNPHGWHRWPAGQRIPTMMTPAILRRGGAVQLVVGSGGSARIRSAILQVIVNYVDHLLPLAVAVSRARVHIENGVLQCEGGYDPAALDTLEGWGYRVNRWSSPSMYFGGAHAVGRSADGRLLATGDFRRDGHALPARS
jgi:gamma-glutamyltranspeptidase/glutathione hydrolase